MEENIIYLSFAVNADSSPLLDWMVIVAIEVGGTIDSSKLDGIVLPAYNKWLFSLFENKKTENEKNDRKNTETSDLE